VVFEKFLLAFLAGSGGRRELERLQMDASDDDRGLADGLHLRGREHAPSLVSNDALHAGPGRVAGRETNVAVVLEVVPGPEDQLQIAGGAKR
jgi:hypothetical protein